MKLFITNLPDTVRNAFKLNQVATFELPLFPLSSVFFPGGTMALKIFEQRYLDMAKICLKTDVPFGIALIQEGNEVGAPAVPEAVGTLAHVTHWDMQNLGILQLRVRGDSRFKLLSQSISKNGLIVGQVSTLPNDGHVDCEEHPVCAEFLRKIIAKIGPIGDAAQQRFEDAEWVGYRLTELLPFGNAVKQKMLELTDTRIRLEILHKFLVDQRLLR